MAELEDKKITAWMGNFNAIIGVVNKNDFYFTKAGQGKIMLMREEELNDIGEDLESGGQSAIESFLDISSGQITPGDKIILATENLTKTVTLDQLKSNIKKISKENFDVLIKLSIEKDSQSVGLIIANIKPIESSFDSKNDSKKKESLSSKEIIKSLDLNKKSFHNKLETPRDSTLNEKKEKLSPFEENPQIYIEQEDQKTTNEMEAYAKKAQENSKDTIEKLKNFFGAKSPSTISKEAEQETDSFVLKEESSKDSSDTTIIANQESKEVKTDNKFKSHLKKNKMITSEKDKISDDEFKISELETIEKAREKEEEYIDQPHQKNKKSIGITDQIRKKFPVIASVSALIVIIFIFIFFAKEPPQEIIIEQTNQENSLANSEEKIENQSEKSDLSTNHLEIKSNIELETITELEDNKDITSIVYLQSLIFIITRDKEFYQINSESGDINQVDLQINLGEESQLIPMPDVDRFFFVSEKETFSYSPFSKKFVDDFSNFPDNLKLKGAGSFMTFLYILNQEDGKILRYPRVENSNGIGFQIAKEWLKTPLTNLDELIGMSVDESIRIAYSNGLIENYFQGVKQSDFNLKVSIDKIKSNSNWNNLYVLSKETGTIFQISQTDNSQIKNFQNSAFTRATDIEVDENNKKLFVTTNQGEVFKVEL